MQKPYEYLKECEPYWPDNSIYFLTESTFLHFPYFKSDDQKEIALEQIKKINKRLNIPISAYSIAQNHLHIKFYLENGLDLAKVKQLIRGGISYEYRRQFKMPYKDIWQSRKTIRVATEEIDWKITGYIIGNLLKHKEVSTFKEIKGNKFSSFWYIAEKYGEDVARDLVYQVIDIDEDSEGGIDLSKLAG